MVPTSRDFVGYRLLAPIPRGGELRGQDTAFIDRHKWEEDREGPFLFTNEHVVEGSSGGRVVHTNRAGAPDSAEPDPGETTTVDIVNDSWRWNDLTR